MRDHRPPTSYAQGDVRVHSRTLAHTSAAAVPLRLAELALIAARAEPDWFVVDVEAQPPARRVGGQPDRAALGAHRDHGDLGWRGARVYGADVDSSRPPG